MPRLLHAARGTARLGGFGSIAFFGVLLSVAAFAYDPAVHEAFDTPKLYALLAASAAALLGLAVHRAVRTPGRVHVTWIEVLLALALLWGLVSNPRWHGADQGIWLWASLALAVLTFVTRQLFASNARVGTEATRSVRDRAGHDLFTALWVNGVALAIIGLRQAFDEGAFRFASGSAKTPMTGLIGIENAYGAFMAAGIIGALVTMAHVRARFPRTLLGGAVLLQLVALLGNGSRGALLGLLAAGLLLGWSRLLLRRPRPGTTALATAGLLLLLAAGTLALYRLNPASGRGRLQAWEISAAMAADHPIRGVGAGRYGVAYAAYQAELWRDPDRARWAYQAARRTQPHSEFVYVLAERGFPGAALFALLWVLALASVLNTIRRAGRASPVDWGLLALLTTIGAHGAVDTTLHWVPTALTAHLALGLVAAPPLHAGSARARRRAAALPLLLAALAYGAVIAAKISREYGAYAQFRQGRLAGAANGLPLLGEARARLPGEARLTLTLAEALLAAGRPDAAIAHLERALEMLDDLEIRLALARAHLAGGQPAAAEQHVRAALASFPDRLRPQLVLAQVRYAAGDHEQARAALSRCIRRETRFGTAAVDAVAEEARTLWRSWYADEPPR